MALLGFRTDERLRAAHGEWIDEALHAHANRRDPSWSQSLAVGRQGFVEGVQAALGIQARHRAVEAIGDTHVLRESEVTYTVVMDGGNSGLSNIMIAFLGRDRKMLNDLRWSDPDITIHQPNDYSLFSSVSLPCSLSHN